MADTASLVARLRARTFSKWSSDVQAIGDFEDALAFEAADAIETITRERDEARAEVARCHERLEIDRYYKINDNLDLVVTPIPFDERASSPDGISSRDATIKLLDENSKLADAALSEARAEVERLREALSGLLPMCEAYADFIRRVPASTLEEHPYLPELERVIEAARALQGSAKQ
jgi:hypothetical protein